MPDPLTRVLPRGSGVPIIFGANALEKRPEIARRIGLVIGAWAYVENALALILGRLLGTQAHVGAAMWEALMSAVARRDALKAAANAMLSGDDLEVFGRLMKVAEGVRKERNPIAHDL